MKKLFLMAVAALMMVATACMSEYDDSRIWKEFDSVYGRIETLEDLCRSINSDISSLQTIVSALEKNDYITSVTPITKGGETIGYSINFAKSEPIMIYHGDDGKDGKDGKDGADGKDGKDGADGVNGSNGYTPVIGVSKAADGIYYWTIDGQWLLDDSGNKVPATASGNSGADGKDGKDGVDGKDGADGKDGKDGVDGKDGADGKDGVDGKDGADGVTPKLKIENDYWYVSYNNGATWQLLGKATGEDGTDGADGADGKDGVDGDSIFKAVRQDDTNVYFELADGTTITIPLATSNALYRLQSISYVPAYSDGKALVEFTTQADSFVVMDFELAPADVAAEIAANWSELLDMQAVNVATRAASFIEMEVLSCIADGSIITVTASGKNLSDSFFKGEQHMSARLEIADECFNHKSEYVPIITVNHLSDTPSVPVTPSKPQPKDNEIIYKSYYSEVVVPYENAVFGANIISNVYNGEYGVITFDATVTNIGYSAFSGNDYITEVYIPNGVTEVNNYAFSNCDRLEVVEFGKSVTKIGQYSFLNNVSLKSIVIPDSVTIIDVSAFEGCKKLESVEIGDGVVTVGSNAFYNCSELTTVVLGKKVKEIHNNAFCGCVYLTTINFPERLEHIYYSAFSGCDSLTSVVLPDSLKTLGNYAFSNCDKLTDVDFGEGVTTIGQYCFLKNVSLKSIVIPDSVTIIDVSAFEACNKLQSVEIGDGVVTVGSNAFYNCSELTTVVLGEKVKEIHNNAFCGCVYLTTINFPERLEHIYHSAFSGCDSLTSVALPDSLKTLGSYAFSNCDKLTSVDFGEGVTSLGDYCFRMCPKLKTVTIPASVTTIGSYAFEECSTLSTVYCEPTTPPTLGYSAFAYNAENRVIYVPASAVSAYQSKWSTYKSVIFAGSF